MNSEQDLIIMHRVLDGDATPEEREALRVRMNADAGLRKEFDALAGALRLAKECRRPPLPPYFTAQVMRKLPRTKASPMRRILGLFRENRTFQWGSAIALIALIAVVAVVALPGPRGPEQAVRTPDVQVARQAARPPDIKPHRQASAAAAAVGMSFAAPHARTVAVAGSFNHWSTDTHTMTKQNNGVWIITLRLEPGMHAYQFVVDGRQWVVDPRAEFVQDDGFGSRNAVVRVRA